MKKRKIHPLRINESKIHPLTVDDSCVIPMTIEPIIDARWLDNWTQDNYTDIPWKDYEKKD